MPQQRTAAPFRADHVGSLKRPISLQDAREQFLGTANIYERPGAHDNAQLSRAEDEAISAVIKLQEDIGLQSVTDGEFRRQSWWTDVVFGFEGPTIGSPESHVAFRGPGGKTQSLPQLRINKRFLWKNSVSESAFRFLRERTRRTAKLTIPAPLNIYYFAGGRNGINRNIYPELELFWDDVVEAYRRELRALAGACRYLQLDEVAIAFMCDPKHQESVRRWGDDPSKLLVLYADVINRILADRPPEMRVTMHLCRGNRRGEWAAEGGYDPVSEILFNQYGIDGFFLEYDSPRSGSFQPLRYVPPGKTVVLGLVSTKTPALEDPDQLMRRIDEASRFIPIEQLCLSPQCGFSSDFKGNPVTIDDEKKKLSLVVDVANRVWGTTR